MVGSELITSVEFAIYRLSRASNVKCSWFVKILPTRIEAWCSPENRFCVNHWQRPQFLQYFDHSQQQEKASLSTVREIRLLVRDTLLSRF